MYLNIFSSNGNNIAAEWVVCKKVFDFLLTEVTWDQCRKKCLLNEISSYYDLYGFSLPYSQTTNLEMVLYLQMNKKQKIKLFFENAQGFNNYQTKIKLSKLKLKVKNENKTSLIPAFPLIFEDQYLDIWGKIFEYSFEH